MKKNKIISIDEIINIFQKKIDEREVLIQMALDMKDKKGLEVLKREQDMDSMAQLFYKDFKSMGATHVEKVVKIF